MSQYRSTAWEEVLEAFDALQRRTRRNAFGAMEIIDETCRRGGLHEESTYRTHIVSHMCIDAPNPTDSRVPCLKRVARGTYAKAET